MNETEWLSCQWPTRLLEFVRSRMSDRKMWLFVAACRRSTDHDPEFEVTRRRLRIQHNATYQTAERLATRRASSVDLDDEFARVSATVSLHARDHYLTNLDVLRAELRVFRPNALLAAYGCIRQDAFIRFENYYSDCANAFDGKLSRFDHPPGNWMHCGLLREIAGNPFRPVVMNPTWRTPIALDLARRADEDSAFEGLPVLADALQEAGCDDEVILGHCRGREGHVRGCWALDLVLGNS
jgi:hypothetical protein